MKIPGMQWIEKAESKGNEVEVPIAENLGLVDFVKLTYKEMNEDHVMAFAGNLTYKALFAIFPFFTFLLSLLGIFRATDLVKTVVDKLSGAASGNGFHRGATSRYHPEPGRERVYLRGDHLDPTRALGSFWSVSLGHGGHERHVRGRGRQAFLEGVRALDLHVARGSHSPGRRARASCLRRVYRCDRRRPRRARVRLRHDLEHRAVASRCPGRPLRLRPDLLLRPRRQTEVPLDQSRVGPRLRLLAHLLAAILAIREHFGG